MHATTPWQPTLPAFKSLDPARIESMIRALLARNRADLETLLQSGAQKWDDLVAPIERLHHRLARAWSPISHLNSVMNTPELRAAYNARGPSITGQRCT